MRLPAVCSLGLLKALLAMGSSALFHPLPQQGTAPRSKSRKARTRHRTGVTYPHSSARQRARYARQIAAGQLSMAGVDTVGNRRAGE